MKFTTFVALVAFGLTTTAAMAQNTQDTTPETAPAETPAAPLPGGDLAIGSTGEPQPGQIYQRETHGDFSIRCVKAPAGETDPCQLFQRLSDQTGNPTADVNFFPVTGVDGVEGGATVVTPLQTLLTAQVTLSVDGGSERRYPFAFCDAQGCYARMGFTAAEMAQFRSGSQGEISVRPALAPDQVVTMRLSLSGFTAGMNALSAPPAE